MNQTTNDTRSNVLLKACTSLDMIAFFIPMDKYRTFGFWVNGVAKLLVITFGFFGNAILKVQIIEKRTLKTRLGLYLRILSTWDVVLLASQLFSTVTAIAFKTMQFHGFFAYMVYMMTPVGSFCVIGTLWQTVAISMERYGSL